MATEIPPAPEQPLEHPSVRYERSDASFRAIFLIILGAMAFAATVHSIMLEFLYRYRDYQTEIKKSPFPLAAGPSTTLPREPRLEQVDRLAGVESPNVYDREAANLELLHSYGPQEEGYIHIPIDRAIQLLLQDKSLRSRPEPSAEQSRRSGGLIDAGEPNSGRRFNRGSP